MSEYWKSTPKYWCKHCNVYVKDTPLERKQHESTGKHQGNLKRFLQTIQNNHTKSEREKDKAKSEVERLNRVVGLNISPAIPSSTAPLSSSKAPSSSTSLSATDQKRQWAQLAEMGISIPESARAEMAMVGDWQIMSRRTEFDSNTAAAHDDKLNIGVKKRKHDDVEDEVEDNRITTVRKGWGAATKSYPGQTSEDLDALLAIPISKKSKATGHSTPNVKWSEELLESESRSDILKSENTTTEGIANIPGDQQGQEIKSTAQQRDLALEHKPSADDMESVNAESGQKIAQPLFKKRKTRVVQAPGNA